MNLNEFLRIGTRIKRIRLDKKMSQKSVADALGIPHSTYSNYENNNRQPNFETLARIADVLDVSIPYLIYGETGEMETDTAEYLLTLSGFQLYDNLDGTFSICDIANNEIVAEVTVTVEQLTEFVQETSNYVTYLTHKLFFQKPPAE